MSAVLQNLVNQPYKHGFVTEIESDVAPKGLERRYHPTHFGKKRRARMDARVSAQGIPAVAEDGRAEMAKCQISENRFSGDQLLRSPKAKKETEQHG